MSKRTTVFNASDITKACKGTLNAGLSVKSVVIDPNGRIVVRCDEVPLEENAKLGWDEATKENAHVA